MMIHKPMTPFQAPAERLIEASPIQEEPIIVHQALAVEPAPLLPPLPPEEFEKPNPIETYSQDFRARMKDMRASTATVLAAEQDSAPIAEQQVASSLAGNGRNILYILAGATLLIGGGAGVYFTYARYQTAIAPVIIAPTASTPIFIDEREQIAGTGVALAQAVKQSVAKPLKTGTVRLLTLGSAGAGTSIFAELAKSAPGMLTRNVDAMNSMAGVVNASSGQSPFFILSVGAYSATFSGMLSWEPAIQNDLALLFPLYAAPASAVPLEPVATTTTATTTKKAAIKTATTTTPTVTATIPLGFRDEVVSNHDVRIYRDATGRSILVYGYWNQETLVIARDPSALIEIFERVATSRR